MGSMRHPVRASFVGVFMTVLVASAPASAAKKPITGKLSKPSYTVVALAANGHARVAEARRGKFRLRLPAKRVTLHLRSPSGTYAGPIVVGTKRKGKRAILGVKAGAKLGKVRVKPRKGYAKVKRDLAVRFVYAKLKARAKEGVPMGAGVFGRVRSQLPRRPVPGDTDFDGIPDALDIDDDGDLVLDDLDPRPLAGLVVAAAASERAQEQGAALHFFLFQSVNANPRSVSNPSEPAFSDNEIDDALIGRGPPLGAGLTLGLSGPPPGSGSWEIDCGRDDPATPLVQEGLSWCRPGGTGIAAFAPPSNNEFPECCDPDEDGFGTMPAPPELQPEAGSTEIKSGQYMFYRVNDASGAEIDAYTVTLRFIVATVPALAAYRDTAGNCATVPGVDPGCATLFSYPVAQGDPGNMGNGFPIAGGPCPAGGPPDCVDGDVVLTVTMWRPQRRPISEDECVQPAQPDCTQKEWIDIGGLLYGVDFGFGGDIESPCPQGAFSGPSSALGGIIDSAVDQPASPANTVTFTVDLSRCGPTWQAGTSRGVSFGVSPATGPPDFASQVVEFESD